MAFQTKNLSVLAFANGFTLWHYITADTPADVDTEGYFNAARDMVRVGDIVLANVDTGGAPANGIFLVSGNDDGIVDVDDITAIGAAAINYAPVAAADVYTTPEDTKLIVGSAQGVLANDADAEADPMTVIGVPAPGEGTVTVASDGAFTYQPSAGFFGTDGFVYTVSDGLGLTDTASVTVTVTEVNAAPVATADVFTTDQDTNLVVGSLMGVLANDADADGDPLTAIGTPAPANGTITLASDGGFTYAPSAGFVGNDTFTYTVTDGRGASDTAQATVAVNAAAPAFLPSDIPSLIGWYEGGVSTLTDAGDGTCSEISDESGMIGDFSQGVAGERPLIIVDIKGGRPGLRFDGVDDKLTRSVASTVFNSDQCDFFLVVKQDSSSSTNNLWGWGTNTNFRIMLTFAWSDNNFYFDWDNTGAQGRLTAAEPTGWDDAWHGVRASRGTDNTQSIEVDGAIIASGTRTDPLGSGTQTAWIGGGAGSFGGDFGALLIFKEKLSGTDLANVKSYLAANWSVSF